MVKRQAHKLSSSIRTSFPEYVIFVDTETTQYSEDNRVYHKLMLGVAIFARFRRDGKQSQKEVYRFNNASAFWEIVKAHKAKKSVMYLISHNAGFDFVVLEHVKYLTAMEYNCLFLYEGGIQFISKWRTNQHSIIILDNANWFSGKLERWGKELDLPKLTMPSYDTNEEKWFIYCERDAEILYQLFLWYTRFLRDNDLGNWKYTLASSAFTAYRHRFMVHPIYIPDNEAETELSRASYHGGRTECFKVGDFSGQELYKVDVNSMYPFVMRDNSYPVRLESIVDNPDILRVYGWLKENGAIADVTITPNDAYFVCIYGKRNIYPLGDFRTVLTTNELRLAISKGWVKNIVKRVLYRTRPFFDQYVDFFYRVKHQASIEGKTLLRSFAKLYLNSLYGKFGQRGFEDKPLGTSSEYKLRVFYGINADTHERFIMRQLGNSVVYSEKGGESYNSFVAIASHVTANARMYLYDLVLKAGREHCFYCDTDSLIVDEIGLTRLGHLMDDNRLGYLKLEEKANDVVIIAPKHYHINGHWTMKGVRPNAERLGTDWYRQEIWPSMTTILASGDERYYNYPIEKHLSPSIMSGTVVPGGTVVPHIMPPTLPDNPSVPGEVV
jgi:hypothetical protein